LPFGIFWPGQAAIALSLLFFSLGYQSLIARQKYSLYILDNIFGNILRLGLLFFVGPIPAFILANFLAFILSLVFLKIKLNFFKVRKQFVEIAGFSGWLGGSFSLASLASKIDVPILYAFAGPVAVGIYSSAQKLASIVPQVAGAVESVFAPKFSADSKSKINDYLLIAIIAGFGLVIASFLAPYLIRPFGSRYAQSALVLSIFLLGFIPLFLSGPFAAKILYKFGKSKWHFYINLCSLFTSLILFLIFTPKFGGIGAAITIACSNLLSFILYYVLWRYLTNKSSKN
ncbi:MAG: polysaccharide biosynthesis C-terminal domain-containing protein, partial [Patescibacteria group bacterium]